MLAPVNAILGWAIILVSLMLFILLHTPPSWLLGTKIIVWVACLIIIIAVFLRRVVWIGMRIRQALPAIRLHKTPAYIALTHDILEGCGLRLRHNLHSSLMPTRPTVFVVNYPNHLVEYAVPNLLVSKSSDHRGVCIVASKQAAGLLSLAYHPDHFFVFDTTEKNNYQAICDAIKDRLSRSLHVYVYVEQASRRLHPDHVGYPLRSGVFHMAVQHGFPITPLAVDHVRDVMGYIPSQNFSIAVGPTLATVTSVQPAMSQTYRFLSKHARLFRSQKCKSLIK